MARGYTKIENSLLDFLYKNDLNASELKVLLFLIRNTKGFHRETVRAAYKFIANGTGFTEETCRKAVKKLIDKEIVSIEYSAIGSRAQVLKVLYKNSWTSGTRTLGGEVQGFLDDKVQELLDQDIKEEIKTIKENNKKEILPFYEEKMTLEELARLSHEEEDDDGDISV